MKKLRAVTFSVLVVLLCGLSSRAQQGTAAAKNSNSAAGDAVNTNTISGSGVKDYVPLWLSGTKLGDSKIFQSTAGNVGIGTTAPAATLDVNGTVNAASFNLGGFTFAFGTLSNQNAFLGFSGNSTMTGVDNTGSGVDTLQSNTTGYENTASGYGALRLNTTGFLNTAIGVGALELNDSGEQNTAIGGETLQNNTMGNLNTAVGVATLPANTTGSNNTAAGWSALKQNTTGNDNNATGYGALGKNTVGLDNSADGFLSLYSNTTGFNNTAGGALALYYNATGTNNTALGANAGPDINSTNLSYATAIGAGAVVSQSNALVLGGPLGSAASVKVGIGTATPSNVFTIAQGAGQAISDGWAVYSSRRWKTNIHTLHGALGKVEQLRGVSYDLKANGKHEVGVIAEEVGAVVPEVVTWDKNGKDAQSVDYSRLTALLIEATKEQQSLIDEQRAEIRAQQAQIARLASQMKTVQASLKKSGPTALEVRRVTAQVWTAHQ